MPHDKILVPAAVIRTAVVGIRHQAHVLIFIHVAVTDVCFVIFIGGKIGAGFAVARFLFLIRFHFFSYRGAYKQTFTDAVPFSGRFASVSLLFLKIVVLSIALSLFKAQRLPSSNLFRILSHPCSCFFLCRIR